MNMPSQAIVPPLDNNKSSIAGLAVNAFAEVWPRLAGLRASLQQPPAAGAAPAGAGAMNGSRQPLSEVVNSADQLRH